MLNETAVQSVLAEDLTALLNRHSRENQSDTPDFILATYLERCLEAFEAASNHRGQWWSPEGVSDAPEMLRRPE